MTHDRRADVLASVRTAAGAGRTRLAHSPRARRAFNAVRYRSLEPGDALLVSYPKSGNTWLRFILGDLLAGSPPDFDTIDALVPLVGSHRTAPRLLPGGRRLVKSHEALSAIPLVAGARAVYVARDGRDVAASYYHAALRRGRFAGSFSAFLQEFIDGTLDGYGPWADHVMSWCGGRLRGSPYLLVVRYEDLLAETNAVVGRVVDFLKLEVGPERVAEAVVRNAASGMRARETGSKLQSLSKRTDISFVREARAGSWAAVFEEEDLRRFEAAAGEALLLCGYPLAASG